MDTGWKRALKTPVACKTWTKPFFHLLHGNCIYVRLSSPERGSAPVDGTVIEEAFIATTIARLCELTGCRFSGC